MIPFTQNPAFRSQYGTLSAQAGRQRQSALGALAAQQATDNMSLRQGEGQLALQKYQNQQRQKDQFWRFGVGALADLAR